MDDAVTGSAVASGITWTLVAKLGRRAVTLAGLAVLARLLMPADFGLLALAASFMLYLETIDDLGTGTALIYWPSDEDAVAQITFVLNLLLGFSWLAISYLCAPYVAAFFRTPDAEPVLKALAWSFPIRSLGNTHEGLSYKQMRCRARVVPEISMAVAKASVSVALAFQGFGVWSLVWGQLAGLAAWAATLWVVVPWRPRLRFPFRLAPRVLAYSRSIVAVNVTSAIVQQADLVVVGRMFSAAALGFYQMAYKIPDMTILLLTSVASKVLFPSYSRLQSDPGSLRRTYIRTFRYVGLLILPAVAGMVMLATPAVVTVFGERWLPSVPLLRALAVYAGVRALGNHAGDVLKAIGRPGALAVFSTLDTILILPALVFACRYGLLAVALTMALVVGPTSLLGTWYVNRLYRVGLREVLAPLAPGAAIATALLLVLAPIRLATAGFAPFVQLGSGLLLGGAVVLVALVRFEPRLVARLGPAWTSRLGRLLPAAAAGGGEL